MSKTEQNKIHLPIGSHLLIEFYACRKIEFSIKDLQSSARDTGSIPVAHAHHKFKGGGRSAVVIIEESHLSIHTYPEFGYAAIDVFTCGDQTDPYKCLKRLKSIFDPTYILINEVKRGVNQ